MLLEIGGSLWWMEIRYYKKALYKPGDMVHQGDFGGNLAHPIQATRWATSRRLFRLRPPLALRQFRPLSRPTGPARGFRGPAILVPTHWCRRPSRARLSSQPENHPHLSPPAATRVAAPPAGCHLPHCARGPLPLRPGACCAPSKYSFL